MNLADMEKEMDGFLARVKHKMLSEENLHDTAVRMKQLDAVFGKRGENIEPITFYVTASMAVADMAIEKLTNSIICLDALSTHFHNLGDDLFEIGSEDPEDSSQD